MEISHALVFHFDEIKTAGSFKKRFSMIPLDVRSFLEWLITVGLLDARRVYQIINKKATTCSKHWEKHIPSRNFELLWSVL